MLRQISSLVGSTVLRHTHKSAITTTVSSSKPSVVSSIVGRWVRSLSTSATPQKSRVDAGPAATVVETQDGRTMAMLEDTRHHPKLKPSIVRKRLEKLKTYVGQEKNIRHSPWRLNLICQMVAGLPLEEALKQLDFCEKSKAPLVQKVLKRTSNLADIRDGLQPSQLEVAECFSTKGTPLKRIKPMARGRVGRMTREHSHMRVVLREIDFKLRIYQARTVYQKRKWIQLQMKAQQEHKVASAERQELMRLEEEQRKVREKQEEEAKKNK